jgi:hypothetical protein
MRFSETGADIRQSKYIPQTETAEKPSNLAVKMRKM